MVFDSDTDLNLDDWVVTGGFIWRSPAFQYDKGTLKVPCPCNLVHHVYHILPSSYHIRDI